MEYSGASPRRRLGVLDRQPWVASLAAMRPAITPSPERRSLPSPRSPLGPSPPRSRLRSGTPRPTAVTPGRRRARSTWKIWCTTRGCPPGSSRTHPWVPRPHPPARRAPEASSRVSSRAVHLARRTHRTLPPPMTWAAPGRFFDSRRLFSPRGSDGLSRLLLTRSRGRPRRAA